MRRWLPLLALLALAGCGSTAKTTAKHCEPPIGQGTAGVCVPKPTAPLPQLPHGATLIPDVSEYQGCTLHGPTIIRVYEAGTEREDFTAACHIQEAHRLRVWAAAYAFLRPGHGGCNYQADRAVGIVRSLGNVSGPVVGDAEVPLPGGFVRCFLARVQHDGYPAVEYTCPGCGEEQIKPVWIAAYPNRPAGTWVAHQFSDNYPCAGVTGDCSINEGILSIHRAKPKPNPLPALYARREALRYLLTKRRCRVIHGPKAYKACPVWAREGRAVNALIAKYHAEGVT